MIIIFAYIVLLVSAILSLRYRTKIYYGFVFLLFLLAAFRDEYTGYDYSQYIAYVERISSTNDFFTLIQNDFIVEPMFLVSTFLIVRVFGLSYLFVFILNAALGVFLKGIYFQKMSRISMITLLLYFQSQYFTGDFAQIRQSVATTFFIASIYYISLNRNAKSIILMALAIASHYTAIIGFLIYPAMYLYNRINYKSLVLSLSFLLFVSFVYSLLGYTISNHIIRIMPFELIQDKAISYQYSEFGNAIVFGITDLIRIVTCILIVCFFRVRNEQNSFVAILYLMGCILYFLLKNDGILASRTTSYFKVLDCLLLVDVICMYTNNKSPVRVLFIALLILVYSFASFYNNAISMPEIMNYGVNL